MDSELEVQKAIDSLCNQFEEHWVPDIPPDFDDFLNRIQQTHRRQLLQALLQVDLELRIKAGQQIQANDYNQLGDEAVAFVNQILQEQDNAETLDPTRDQGTLPPASPSKQIGPYKLLQPIGEGGMGTVWMAEQSEPVKRRVALKLIKTGVGSKEILARFEGERQALALMNHPNIARILDAGTTDDGQPYFVMELVTGIPLTKYCDDNRIGIDERLNLFTEVCSGVQHAHQKGIIHRDLKPGNILVGMLDGKPVPKIIDFGLAKAIESTQRLTDQSVFTGIGQILGTLKYMSPEQASLDAVDIDTRTDIYALGVILYELLTGSTPLDDSSMKGQAALKVLEFIREKEPVKPSSRLGSITDEQKSSITNQRRTDSVRLNRVLLGDLDWIVMKALEKDRTRRYESASGFAADIRRYLNSEPVVARPPSLNYRVRKFVRKNRVGVMAASLVILSLIGGIVGTSLAMFRAWDAEKLASDRLGEAVASKKEETEQRKLAETRRQEAVREKEIAEQNLAYAKKGNEILGSVFADLDPDAEYDEVSDLRNALGDNLNKAVEELEGSAIGDPLEVAAMQDTLGWSLMRLGQANSSIEVFKKAVETKKSRLGADHLDTLISINNLALGYQDAGRLEKALPLFEETLKLREAKLGLDHPRTLSSMNNLATGYVNAGQLDKALPLLEQTLELSKTRLGADDRETLETMNNLAMGYQDAGQLDKALPLYAQTLELMKAKHGADNSKTLDCMNNLATCYWDAGQLDKALPLLELTLKLSEAKLGANHPQTLGSMNNLANGYHVAGQLDKALPLHELTLERLKLKLGLDHPNTLGSMNNLAACHRAAGQLDKALPLYEQTLELRKAKLGVDHPETLISMNNLAACLRAAGQLNKALPLLEQTLEMRKTKLGPDHPDTLLVMSNLALIYQEAGQLEKGLPLVEQAALGIEKLRFENQFAKVIIGNTIKAYEEAKQFERADQWRLKWIAFLKSQASADKLEYSGELAAFGLSLVQRQAWAEAEPVLRECLSIREKSQPDSWSTFNTKSMLGAALLGQEKYVDAEPVLLAGYEGMNQREETIPAQAKIRLIESIKRLVDLYTALDQPEKAAEWKSKLPPEEDSSGK